MAMAFFIFLKDDENILKLTIYLYEDILKTTDFKKLIALYVIIYFIYSFCFQC